MPVEKITTHYPVPTSLAHTSARVLEFESLRDLLRAYTPSPLGQAKVALLVASSDREWIEAQQQLTTEIREFRRVGGRFEFSGLLDVNQSVEKARIVGAALETGEIRDIVLVVDRAAEWREEPLQTAPCTHPGGEEGGADSDGLG